MVLWKTSVSIMVHPKEYRRQVKSICNYALLQFATISSFLSTHYCLFYLMYRITIGLLEESEEIS